MKRLMLFAAVAVLFAGAAILQAEDANKKECKSVKQLTKADNGKTVKIAVGESFDVVLRGNPTTGYGWHVERIEGGAVEQNGKADYVVDKHPEGMVGVGGTYTFHFDVKKAAKTKLRLVYVRSWEKDTPPAKTFEAVIDSEK